MADRRPNRGNGPRGTRRPTGPRGARPRPGSAGAGATPTSRTSSQSVAAPRRPRERPRFTGRAAILVLVLAVLTVSFASSMRAYLQQQRHISDLKSQIAETSVAIDNLEREKRRWDDEAFVKDQARQRFGYIMPGETGYMVIDEQGNPLDSPDQLSDASDLPEEKPQAWWTTAWNSMEAAGFPHRDDPDIPADKIKPPADDD